MTDQPTNSAIREQLQRMLAAPTFREAQRASALLNYIIEETLNGRASAIKEYTLGVDVLDRGGAFDPRIDGSVRVEMSRLRGRIDQYYANEGRTDPVRIALPRGAYVPEFAHQQPPAASAVASAMPISPTRWGWWQSVSMAAALLIGLTAGILGTRSVKPSGEAATLRQFEIHPALPGTTIGSDVGVDMALSTDGQQLVFVARAAEGGARLYVRDLATLQTRELPGTYGARGPFLSPDAQWVGFHADGALRRVHLDGKHEPQVIVQSVGLLGASWEADGRIVAALDYEHIVRVDPANGRMQVLLRAEEQARVMWPQSIDEGRAVLLTHVPAKGEPTIELLVLATGERRALVRNAMYGRTLGKGLLLYAQEDRVFAQRFDPATRTVRGAAFPVLDGVMYAPMFLYSQLATSANAMAFRRGSSGGVMRLQRLTTDGQRHDLAPAGRYQWPRVSPDGQRVAFVLQEAAHYDLWVLDLASGTRTRIAADGVDISSPVWMPDGHTLLYGAPDGVHWVDVYGGRGGLLLASEGARIFIPRSVANDGSALAYYARGTTAHNADTHLDVWTVPLASTKDGLQAGTPSVFRRTPSADTLPEYSPDGRWLAYASSESGAFEVYVRAVPDNGRQWRVSDGGGARAAVWSIRTRELLYRTDDQKIHAVSYGLEQGQFTTGKPRLWSTVQLADTGVTANFDLFPDGRSAAVLTMQDDSDTGTDRNGVVVVTGIVEEVVRRLEGHD